MIRKIIQIDEEKCNGCGACAHACHEEAIEMINGKAHLIRDDYCDGMGDCLPECPTGAISFIEREALPYDEKAVLENKQKHEGSFHASCPGHAMHQFHRENQEMEKKISIQSQLCSWPVQIKLAPINAPYFDGAKLLIAADCTAYAYANFHQEFMRGKVTLIGCPKLDDVDYSKKLCEIIRQNNIQSVTIVRMEVPCCGGLQQATIKALKESGKFIPWQVITLSIDGQILED